MCAEIQPFWSDVFDIDFKVITSNPEPDPPLITQGSILMNGEPYLSSETIYFLFPHYSKNILSYRKVTVPAIKMWLEDLINTSH